MKYSCNYSLMSVNYVVYTREITKKLEKFLSQYWKNSFLEDSLAYASKESLA